MSNELDFVDALRSGGGPVADAVDAAAAQDQITWLTEDGKRIAAIVPVDVAQAHEDAARRARGFTEGEIAAAMDRAHQAEPE